MDIPVPAESTERCVAVIPATALLTIAGAIINADSPQLVAVGSEFVSIDPILNEMPRFASRATVEDDPRWLQPIPYVVVQRATDGRVLAYRRPAAATEQRLAGQRSIGFGGHVEPCDQVFGTSRLGPMLERAAVRELFEELGVARTVPVRPFGFVFDRTTPVGRVHLGILHRVCLMDDQVEAIDASEVIDPVWLTIRQLAAECVSAPETFEAWSRAAIQSFA